MVATQVSIPFADLQTQIKNDKGRYRQQRAMPMSKTQPLLQTPLFAGTALIGSESHPLQSKDLGILIKRPLSFTT
jgi:hypothetical protein